MMMPTTLSNLNFFILNVRQSPVYQPRRVRGILGCHVRIMLAPSFESEDCVHGANISKTGQNIPTSPAIIRIEAMTSSQKPTRRGRERSA
jgi:hypothetical protein